MSMPMPNEPPAILPFGPPPGAIPAAKEETLRGLGHLLSELRLLPRMYFDPRYRLSRFTQISVPLLLLAMVANYLFFTYSIGFVPLLPMLAERLILMMLAVLTYHVLSREVARYRAVLDYLAKYGGS